jgi:molybdopterin-guanine dinucleotide biosynthesis protein A
MGRDKALLPVDGEPLAVRVASALADAGAATVVCVGGDLDGLRGAGLDARPDRHPGEGPLGGLLTAWHEVSTEILVALACDHLAPEPGAIRILLDALDGDPGAVAAIPVLDGRWQPLHAAHHRRGAATLEAAFAAGERSLKRALGDARVVVVTGIAAEALADADTPDDLPPDGR